MKPALEEGTIKITKSKMKKIADDREKTAEAIHLVYVNDNGEGITRIKKENGFEYLFKEKKVTDNHQLQRIKSLAIPPAWENIWICNLNNGHLQATGMDIKKRKQYKYHPLWNKLRNQTKFYRMYEFGKSLPCIRLRLEQDITSKEMPQQKVLAIVVSLMESTHIRIGNNFYEKLYGSFGLTTLKVRHVKINGNKLVFSFKGKKGITHNITLKNKRLATLVQQCKDIPGKELFQYYDENGNKRSVDSGMVNNYIKEISKGDFTAKDFRTWAGTIQALLTLKEAGDCKTETEKKKNILTALNTTAMHLGNTRNVCKKYYVNPLILSLYENDKLSKYFPNNELIKTDSSKTSLTNEENILLKILESAENSTGIL
jgi:DNA topoisomerase-1